MAFFTGFMGGGGTGAITLDPRNERAPFNHKMYTPFRFVVVIKIIFRGVHTDDGAVIGLMPYLIS